jgi:hypothetical protein
MDIRKETVLGTFLPNLAVSDASHDFNGARANDKDTNIPPGNIFKQIWKNYKDVGVPHIGPLSTEVLDEYSTLNKLIPFLKGDSKISNAQQFQREFLREDLNKTVTIISGEPDYKIRSLKISDETDDKWLKTSSELYDWLNPHKQSAIAFLIDASKGRFYDLLMNDKKADSSIAQKKAYIINNREGVNDAAGKLSISNDPNNIVSLEEINDTDTSHILYPIMDLERITQLTSRELFCSKYALTVSPIKLNNKKEVITLGITNKDLTRQVTILKGTKEESHPNAVPTLISLIDKLLSSLLKSGEAEKKTLYHTYLQQKRSGDWLQVLSCLDTIRYKIPEGTRIMFVTLDTLALVYALIMGVDVLFTYVHSGQRWLIFFHKDIGGVTRSEGDLIKGEIALYPRFDTDARYIECKVNYISQHLAISRKVNTSIEELIKTIKTPADEKLKKRFKGEETEKKIKQLLERFTDLAIFRSIAPEVKDKKEEDIFNPTAKLDEIKALKGIYLSNYSIIKKAIDGRINREATSGNFLTAMNIYLSSILSKPSVQSKDTKIQHQRKELINNLSILGSIFRAENGGKNGIGIFAFLKCHLTNDECTMLIEALEALVADVNASSISTKNKDKYNTFLNLSKILIVPTTTSKIPDVTEIPNEELLSAIDSIYPVDKVIDIKEQAVKPVAEIESVELEGNEADDALEEGTEAATVDLKQSTFSITDFHAATILLGHRAINAFKIDEHDSRLTGGGKYLMKDHNPLTTFYLLLREISYRLRYNNENSDDLIYLSKKIHKLIEINPDYTEYAAYEYYALETLPKTNRFMKHVMYDFKRGYYGFTDSISSSYASKPSLELNISTDELSSEEIIEKNLDTMREIILIVKAQEKILKRPPKFALKTGMTSQERSSLYPKGKIMEGQHAGSSKSRNARRKRRNGSPRRKTLRKTRKHK